MMNLERNLRTDISLLPAEATVSVRSSMLRTPSNAAGLGVCLMRRPFDRWAARTSSAGINSFAEYLPASNNSPTSSATTSPDPWSSSSRLPPSPRTLAAIFCDEAALLSCISGNSTSLPSSSEDWGVWYHNFKTPHVMSMRRNVWLKAADLVSLH